MAAAQVLKNPIGTPECARYVGTNTDDSFSDRLVVEERVELDHSMHVRKWDT
jgi:hypothetical protein